MIRLTLGRAQIRRYQQNQPRRFHSHFISPTRSYHRFRYISYTMIALATGTTVYLQLNNHSVQVHNDAPKVSRENFLPWNASLPRLITFFFTYDSASSTAPALSSYGGRGVQSPAAEVSTSGGQDATSSADNQKQLETSKDHAGVDSDDSENPDSSQKGAYDPVTGKINWDCPCLGDMPHGPCGPQFREAFSCFIHSEEEPKGIDCVEKFKGMQACFKEHPEVYGDEIMEDDEDDEAEESVIAKSENLKAAADESEQPSEELTPPPPPKKKNRIYNA